MDEEREEERERERERGEVSVIYAKGSIGI